MEEIEVTPAMIAAGVEAVALIGETDTEMLVEVIYRAMAQASSALSSSLAPARVH
jgi:hypothetical protein